MLHIARVVMLNSNRMRKMNISEAIDELDRAKELLDNSTRLVQYDYIYLILIVGINMKDTMTFRSVVTSITVRHSRYGIFGWSS